jgi:hypothetical protein
MNRLPRASIALLGTGGLFAGRFPSEIKALNNDQIVVPQICFVIRLGQERKQQLPTGRIPRDVVTLHELHVPLGSFGPHHTNLEWSIGLQVFAPDDFVDFDVARLNDHRLQLLGRQVCNVFVLGKHGDVEL